jgi:hypothetical protein
MDPYLEREIIWHDFHERLLPAAAAQLSVQVLPRYIVLIDERIFFQDAITEEIGPIGRPDSNVTRGLPPEASRVASAGALKPLPHIVVPDLDEERESFLAVCDRATQQLITVIEVLTPAKKRPGEIRRRYLSKRANVLNSAVHLVEIDLLRGGQPMPGNGQPECVYSVLVSRAGDRTHASFWPIGLRDKLPLVPIPLRPDEPDAELDLRGTIDRVYDEAGYRFFLYGHEPEPPLAGEDAAWADGIKSSLD